MQYIIKGKVVKGDGYGRKIGFPTVNLSSETKQIPPDGVYAGLGLLEGKEYKAGIVIGPNDKIEAHLIGYDGDAYGKQVSLQINKFLREFKKFENEKELIKQIETDINLITRT
jgi:riboflavin kinase/FMN adenylyltransferase